MCEAIGYNAKCRICLANRVVFFHHFDHCRIAEKTGVMCKSAKEAARRQRGFAVICHDCNESIHAQQCYIRTGLRPGPSFVQTEETKRRIEAWMDYVEMELIDESRYKQAWKRAASRNKSQLQNCSQESLVLHRVDKSPQDQKPQQTRSPGTPGTQDLQQRRSQPERSPVINQAQPHGQPPQQQLRRIQRQPISRGSGVGRTAGQGRINHGPRITPSTATLGRYTTSDDTGGTPLPRDTGSEESDRKASSLGSMTTHCEWDGVEPEKPACI